MRWFRYGVLLAVVVGCGKEKAPVDPVEPLVCGSANRPLPAGLVELSWDDGTAYSDITHEDWTVEGEVIREAVLNESVRFELAHPARIHGFAVQWIGQPGVGYAGWEISAGIYPDFGHNGFDFWPEPLWEGTRCWQDIEPGAWTTYVPSEPIEVPEPGLIHVSHQRDWELALSWAFDASWVGAGDCAGFEECHSAMNLPEASKSEYFNGVSFPLAYDYLVRLYVEYLDDVGEAETIFQKVDTDVSMGKRQSWGDFDRDGDDDLFSGSTLLRNDNGIFVDVTEASGLVGVVSSGGVWGDYDNDGCLDLFVFAESAADGDSLWHSNCDGTFVDVTAAVGIDDVQTRFLCEGDPAQDHRSSPAAAWWDWDADGWLDLYVVGFICWDSSRYYEDQVFHNEGGTSFTDVTGTLGFVSGAYPGRGAAPIDFDQDGDVDLLVNNYMLERNLCFTNNGDGTVTEDAEIRNLAGSRSSEGYYGHTIGVAWGDLDNDGQFDGVQANLAHPRFFDFSDRTQVLLNDGQGVFDAVGGVWQPPVDEAGLRYQETYSVPMLGDFDHDSHLDLVISATYDGRPTDFYWGRGDGTFIWDSYHAGIAVSSGWGMAAADWDHDGDLDVAAKKSLWRNDRRGTGHWLQAQVVGNQGANRGGYGATVVIDTGSGPLIRHVSGGTGQGNQDSPVIHVGLGSATTVSAIHVVFPGGERVDFPGPWAADQKLWLFQDGTTAVGWTPPSP